MRHQGNKAVPVATILLLCYSIAQLASSGWWLIHTAGQGTCRLDDEGQWSIGLYKGSSPFDLQPLELHEPRESTSVAWPVANPVLSCASVADSPSSFVADPFLWHHHDGLYMFFESKSIDRGRGEIGVARSTDGGLSFKHLGIVLSENWHLSYPYVFGFRGQVFMVPEGSASGQLRLYRAKNFPWDWELDRVLVDRPLVDASLVEYEGRWWMFASDLSRRGAKKNGELEVWYADSPLGPWHEHAANPVMNGARHLGARSGGRPVVHDGKLYRFGQDCGETYGHKVMAFEITKLSPTEFEQVRVELSLGAPSGSKKRVAWNSKRQHHIDVHRLTSGEWVAAMDGDRVVSGAISQKMLHTAVLAIGPWIALLVAWGAIHALARYRPSLHHQIFRYRSGPLAAPLLTLPLKVVPGIVEQHKRDDSDYLECHSVLDDLEYQHGQHAGVNTAIIHIIEAEGPSSVHWWARQWPSLSHRRAYSTKSLIPEVMLSPRSSKAMNRGRGRASFWVALAAVVPFLAGFGAAVGIALYLGPFFMPYRALAVDGQYSQFTLVSMTYDARMPTLRHMVRHYSRCPSVAEIVLVWNRGQPPVPELDFDSAVPVRVRVEERNSLNNRFKIDPLIRTRAVLSLDDDIMMPCADIENGFAIWRMQPEKMVGFYPRLIEGEPLEFRGESYSIDRGQYNAVLTGAAFIDTWTAFPAYWEDAVQPARDTVDQVFNGEDLLMNFVLANRTNYLLGGFAHTRRQQQLGDTRKQHYWAGMAADQKHSESAADHAVLFIPPTRRVDISKLSGVGISHDFARFKQQTSTYLANFTSTFGYVPLVARSHSWERSRPPLCAIGWLGCTYIS